MDVRTHQTAAAAAADPILAVEVADPSLHLVADLEVVDPIHPAEEEEEEVGHIRLVGRIPDSGCILLDHPAADHSQPRNPADKLLGKHKHRCVQSPPVPEAEAGFVRIAVRNHDCTLAFPDCADGLEVGLIETGSCHATRLEGAQKTNPYHLFGPSLPAVAAVHHQTYRH